MKKKMEHNRIYHGDNMYYMPDMPDQCIDLIYIDPPFGTQSLLKSHAFKEKVQELQFYDVFGGGREGYLNFMRERLRNMWRLLSPKGVLCVHLDWRMSHYIKIELDKIFGVNNPCANNSNFINEIIWHYSPGHSPKNKFKRKHDSILVYSKSKKYTFNQPFMKYQEKDKYRFNKRDRQGRLYRINHIKDNAGNYKRFYWDKGTPQDNIITYLRKKEYNALGSTSKERTPWPTQKPLALLNLIIKTFTNKSDIVADFFCGCGTTVVSAQRLDRKWIGFDASMIACKETLKRIKEDQPLFNQGISKKPMTIKDFEKLDHFAFEKHAVRHIGGVTNNVPIGDEGVDGRLAFDGTPIQVTKAGKRLGDTDKLRAFYEHTKEHGRGIVITLNGYTNKAKERANKWRSEGLEVHLLTIKDILNKHLNIEQSQQPQQNQRHRKAA